MRFYGTKTRIDKDGKPSDIIFLYPNQSKKIRSLDRKEFHSEGDIAKAGLYGRDRFSAGSHKYVTITEGELDAHSLYQVLRSPVVSVQSSSSAVRDCSSDREWLDSFERIYLCFDNDEVGRSALSKVARLFDFNKIYQVKLTRHKDANEYLKHNEVDELRQIWWNSKRYLPETVISSFSDFEKILSEPAKKGVRFPFKFLNDMTYGMRPGESILITAQEGVGKTEVMRTLEHHLLKETNDAIGSIFLEEGKKRHLLGLAGIELKRPAHLDVEKGEISETQIFDAVKSAVGDDDRLHIYSHFGSDDPEVIIDTIRFLVAARSCRYILLDHISMVVSGLAGEDERRALDYLCTRLEMMVKELDFCLIFVSHVNDSGQTRGSRYISKIADLRINLTRDVESDNTMDRLTTHVRIAKNRFAYQTGYAGRLIFDPIQYLLKEDWELIPLALEDSDGRLRDEESPEQGYLHDQRTEGSGLVVREYGSHGIGA